MHVDGPKEYPVIVASTVSLTLFALADMDVYLTAPASYDRLMGNAAGTPELAPVLGTQAPPLTNAESGVVAGARNSAHTWESSG